MKRIKINEKYKKPLLIGCGVVALIIICVIWNALKPAGVEITRESDEAAPVQEQVQETEHKTIRVHVDGAVVHPGLYNVEGDDPRVQDAVTLAGGLTQEADTSEVNLAEKIEDGLKIYIPSKSESAQEQSAQKSSPSQSSKGTASSATSKGSSSGSQSKSSTASSSTSESSGKTSDTNKQPGLVNINTATQSELETLTGVGPSTAKAIIADREANGRFTSKQDLMRVKGIGEKKYAKLESQICV